ncbi:MULTISPECIES: GntR family transcriptional regulator [Aerococcus]|uniref:GntR family transcriptional regulator n=1 Tax=Aerococcus sanguinicola TaxID=119206 RepID=A0A5N1GFV5_9LACT|nr:MULTISPECIES: GntR family transcriptional regulator [Aerococcus]KAA9299264.1 GntR family transcriptional regulator [Aerococcus sanguinicola]MDK6370113.1 GntR family transcriptional regulator [Aerococcus sp. UMB9870]MDK6680717.1 GntR family transcriptional regulator [Aerococcus sp. UMB8608]MDK6687511.1 GntR family transcriptional regulator [Aerococcus sp. UMB8623]MDK6940667.1 GntR family transcriptional regulator [Aerococcus sp. UMB8487]
MHILLSSSSGQPIYQQIVQEIQGQILKGSLAPGQQLPSLRQLARDLKVSIITTKRAYEELEEAGFVQSIPGKGTFVARLNVDFLQEQERLKLDHYLQEATRSARKLGLNAKDLYPILQSLFEEEESSS